MSQKKHPHPRARQEIDSWVSLEQILRGTFLRKLYANGRPAFMAGDRPVAPDIAEKAIHWGLVKPLDRDLFGDPKNAQLWTLKWRGK
jgi:hypothetical protein